MADYIEGQDLVKQDAYDAVLKLDKMMGDLVAKFDLVAKSAIHMQTAIGDTKGLENLTALYKKQQEEVQKVITIEKELEKTVRLKDKAIMEANLAIQEQNLNTKNAIKLNQAQEGSINQLRLQLNQATKAYDAMSKAERESGKGTTLLTNIQNTTTALKQLEANTGRFQRNVGNYTNATFQLTQVMRELPNFAQSAEIGIRSLGNNLPMLADSFGQVRKEAGGTWPALKIFGESLLTFSGIFPLVLMGLISYSDEIINFITGNNTAKESISDLEEAFNSAVENGYTEVAVLKNLYDATQDVSKSMDERLDAVNKLQTLYPQYFGNLKDEEILAGKAKDAYLDLKDALMDTIITRAYYAQADVIGKDIVKNTLMVDELSKKLSELTSQSTGNKPNEFIYNRNNDVTQLQDYINELQKAGGVGEELAKKLLANNEGGIYSSLRKVRDELSDNIMTAESDLQRLLNIARYMYGSEVKSSKSTSAPKAPKAEKTKAPEIKRDVLTEMKTNLAQLQLESKESIRAGIQDNFKDSANLMAEQIDKLQAEINKNQLSVTIEWTNQDKLEAWLEEAIPVLEAISGIAQSMQQATQSVTGALSDKVNREAELQIEAIDAKTQAELDAIDRLTLSESERDERKKIVELEAEARRKKIEEDKIKQLRKFAAVQKAADILAISAATALAVMNTLADKKLIALQLAIPAAIAVGIAGAAQIAAVAARPLPQYEFGTPEGGHTGGKAIVGEAGTELGRTPDGKLFLTPSKASIMDLPKRTEIIPHDITKDLLGATMVRLAQANTAVSLDMYQDELIEAFERGTDKITKAIYKNRTNISIGGNYRDYVKSNQL